MGSLSPACIRGGPLQLNWMSVMVYGLQTAQFTCDGWCKEMWFIAVQGLVILWSAMTQQQNAERPWVWIPFAAGFESPKMVPFQNIGIFVLCPTSQFNQLCKWVPGLRMWWKCDWIVFASNCCMARMLPREAELVSEWTGLPGEEKCKALWAVQWTGYMCYIKTHFFYLYFLVFVNVCMQ